MNRKKYLDSKLWLETIVIEQIGSCDYDLFLLSFIHVIIVCLLEHSEYNKQLEWKLWLGATVVIYRLEALPIAYIIASYSYK